MPLVEPELLTLPEHYSGGSYDQSGSASDYVCLSPDPKFLKTSGLDFGPMYGAEYEIKTKMDLVLCVEQHMLQQ